jgi:hypothetical protein
LRIALDFRVVIAVTYKGSWDRDLAIAFAQNINFTDPRAVVMALATNYTDDWILGTRGGDDFWIRAETFVTRKRGREIDSKRLIFCLNTRSLIMIPRNLLLV